MGDTHFVEGLIRDFRVRVLDLELIINALKERHVIQSFSELDIDHIAFRTLGVPYMGADALDALIVQLGYTKRDSLQFPDRGLDAWWYDAPAEHLPRIFISQYRIHELSSKNREIVKRCMGTAESSLDTLRGQSDSDIAARLLTPFWQRPTWEEYQSVLDENEYVAWVLYHQFLLSHVSIGIHSLPTGYNTVETFGQLVESINLNMNCVGGKYKVSDDGLLVQAATMADHILSPFISVDGKAESHVVAGSFIEFMERRLVMMNAMNVENKTTHTRRDGFDVSSSNLLFDSTVREQQAKLF